MFTRALLVSLGITLLTSVIIFMYFRKRLSVVEHKLNMMFQLIEEHNQQQNVQFHPTPHPVTMPMTSMESMPSMESMTSIKEDLITVSDGEESDADTNDSESDSDSDSDSDNSENSEKGQINISDNSNQDVIAVEEIKTINLSFNHAEEKKETDSLDDLDDLESLEDSISKVVISDLNDKDNEQTVHYNNLIEKITTTIAENKTDEVSTVNFSTLKVPELKKMARERNIKVKGLRKAELITALEQN